MRKFKSHLKSEIEVFVANIFLRVLESPNSPFEQKVLVLEALRALCADAQMLTQLFLNYDCDFDAVNLYKDIVHHVTRISARAVAPQVGTEAKNKKIVDQELALSRTGLEVLVVTLQSFLKSLGLPGGDDVFGDSEDGRSSSLSMLRQTLKIDIGIDTSTTTVAVLGMENKASAPLASASSNPSEVSLDRSADLSDRSNSIDATNSEVNAMSMTTESSDVAGKIVDAFDKKRTAQQNFEIGRVKFTLSLKSGIAFFIENDFVELDARDMARFLYENSETLDKTQIGELLGREPEAAYIKDDGADPEMGGPGFYLSVLYHYVDQMEFQNMLFDDAIRLFLSGFRLPGEAQKVGCGKS